jgi:hypothetical protein
MQHQLLRADGKYDSGADWRCVLARHDQGRPGIQVHLAFGGALPSDLARQEREYRGRNWQPLVIGFLA